MILNRQRRVRVVITPLERFLARVRREVGLPADALTVCLASNAEMERWNAAYRGKPGPTDVLSFPADGNERNHAKQGKRKKQRAQRTSSAPRPRDGFSASASSSAAFSTCYLGDIAIAPAIALRNARRFGRTLPEELRILILHGVLHLMGYDHETDAGEMDRREFLLRRRLGLG